MTAARRIAAMAEAYGASVAPHNPQEPVSTAASIEYGFATPNYLICEAVHQDVPWRDEVVNWGFEVDPRGRTVKPSARPGLGVEVNEAVIARHPFQQELPRRSYGRDGSIIDW